MNSIFGAPDMVSADKLETRRTKLKSRKPLSKYSPASPTTILIKKSVENPPTEMTEFAHMASTSLARQIIVVAGWISLNDALDHHTKSDLPIV